MAINHSCITIQGNTHMYVCIHTKGKSKADFSHVYPVKLGDLCTKQVLQVGAGQILLVTGHVPRRRAVYASRMMAWPSKDPPEPQAFCCPGYYQVPTHAHPHTRAHTHTHWKNEKATRSTHDTKAMAWNYTRTAHC